MIERIKRYKKDIIIILLFIILPFLFFNDSFKIKTLIFGNGDPNYNTLPLWDLIVTSIRNGEFPFWNKYIYSGFPLFANPQSSILYPVLWVLYFVFPLSVAYNISILLHYSLAGIFTYIFLNRYNLDKLASFGGGLVFMFSGLMICHKGHAQMLYTVIWFPLILYFLDKFRESRRFEFIFAGSIFYAFAFFAGNPQVFFYGSMVILLYIIYYSFIHARRSYYFLYSAAIFIITALLISVQLFPIYELMNHSVRSTLDFGTFSFFSYPRKLILTLISPFIYGAGPTGVGFFGALSYIETVAYFGITTIPFLIIGFFSKNRDKYFWIFILVFSFVLVMGMNTPFYKLMYHIPLYNKFRIPTRNWFEFGLAFAILTGFGFDYFIKNFNKKIKKIIIAAISLLGMIGIVLGFSNLTLKKMSTFSFFNNFIFLRENMSSLLQTTNLKNYATYIPLIFIFALIFLLVFSIFKRNKLIYIFFIVLIFFDLRSFGNYIEGSSNASYINKDLKRYEEFSFIKSETQPYRFYPVVDWGPEGATIYPNRNIHYGIDLVSGYDPLMLGDYSFFMGMFYMDNKEKAEMLMRNNNILSILNTKYIMYFKPENYDAFLNNITKVFYKEIKNLKLNKVSISEYNNYKAVYDKDILILKNNDCMPRFYFTEKVRNISDIDEAYKILWETEAIWEEDRFDPKAETLVEKIDFNTIEFDTGNSKVEIQEYTNNRAKLNITTESDEFLVFSDTYYPGWKAYIDGKQVKIYKTNGIIKGIFVPQGKHIVEFTFLPNNFWIYFSISITTLAGIIISMVILKKIK